MSARKKEINDLAGCQRALCQGNCAPNHYWDTTDQRAGQDRALRADGARGQDLRHRLVEVVLPHRSRPLGQRLQARRREADLSVLRAVEEAGAEDLQRPQGLRLAVADARAPGQSGRRREGGPRPSRSDVHHLPLGPQARTRRAGVQEGRLLRPDDRRLRLARRADEDQAAQSEDEQRLSARSARRSAAWRSSTRSCAST